MVMSGVYNQYPDLDIPLIEYKIRNMGDEPVTLTLISEIQDYTSLAKNMETVGPHSTKIVSQTPLIKSDIHLKELKTANLYYKVSSEDKVIDEQTLPIKLYAEDTMIWAIEEDGEIIDTTDLIGAWVTPNVYEIQELLRIAAEYHPDRTMSGYQCFDCQTQEDWRYYTAEQVGAIYDALKYEYQITYINTPTAFGIGEDSVQRVRLPTQSLAVASANCSDGTLVFASALEAIGIKPIIAILPDHAFVCWYTDPNDEVIDCLETTMIGSAEFEDAWNSGAEEVQEYWDAFSDDDPWNGELISVEDIRAVGIKPME